MDISEKTVDELKVIAYDLGVQFERLKYDLQVINQQIMKKQEEAKCETDS